MKKKVIMENIGAIRGYQKKINKCLDRMFLAIYPEDKK